MCDKTLSSYRNELFNGERVEHQQERAAKGRYGSRSTVYTVSSMEGGSSARVIDWLHALCGAQLRADAVLLM